MNKKILAVALAALMSVSMTSVAFADKTGDGTGAGTPVVLSEETTVSSYDELAAAIKEKKYDVIKVSGAIDVSANAKIEGHGERIVLTTSLGSGAFITIGSGVENVAISNLVIDTNGKAKHGVQFYRSKNSSLTGVTVKGGYYTSVIVNGATDITLTGCTFEPSGADVYANVEYAMGKDVVTPPQVSVSSCTFGNSNVPAVWADMSTLESLGLERGATAEQIAKKINVTGAEVVAPSLSKEGEIVAVSNGGVVFEGTEDEYLEEKYGRDDSESRSGGDYFGNEKWAAVKREIVAADEGDTIKVSATGLPWFPSSVARALKGRDITLEVRKNGVTYSINGLEIGAIEKIWYEFDQIDTELLTAEAPESK